jgi:hypothetical protein
MNLKRSVLANHHVPSMLGGRAVARLVLAQTKARVDADLSSRYPPNCAAREID